MVGILSLSWMRSCASCRVRVRVRVRVKLDEVLRLVYPECEETKLSFQRRWHYNTALAESLIHLP